MTNDEHKALAYAMRKQRAKRARQWALFGRIKYVTDLRTGERTRVIILRFPVGKEGN